MGGIFKHVPQPRLIYVRIGSACKKKSTRQIMFDEETKIHGLLQRIFTISKPAMSPSLKKANLFIENLN